jgi:alpha-L-fucosidase 2
LNNITRTGNSSKERCLFIELNSAAVEAGLSSRTTNQTISPSIRRAIEKEKNMRWNAFVLNIVLALWPGIVSAGDLDRYNVVWKSHSEIPRHSMPTGNGDIGLNVWTEMGGDLLIYLNKTDSFDEQCRLLKLGRLRVHFSNNPFANGKPFKQELCLQDGTIRIDADGMKIVIWADANWPVVHVEATVGTPFKQTITLEMWRTKKEPIAFRFGKHGVDSVTPGEEPLVYPDTLLPDAPGFPNQIVRYHRNEVSLYPATIKAQDLEPLPAGVAPDPLLHRTFGAVVKGADFVADGPGKLSTAKPQTSTRLTIVPLTRQTPSAKAWLDDLKELQAGALAVPVDKARAAHDQWWATFWDRSHVRITGGEAKEIHDITQGWHVYRFMVACMARGGAPIKFNGGIFTFDGENFLFWKNEKLDPDDRAWGPGYWHQNQRHVYWPMLTAGDHHQLLPFFKMYRDALPLAKHRTKTYYKHDGAFFPETMYLWGTYLNGKMGYGVGADRNGHAVGVTTSRYIRYHWQGGLETSAMMLQYYDYTQDAEFVKATLLPVASSIVTFYEQHYKRGGNGKIKIWPAQGLESIWDCVNPTPEIAGLRYCITKLLALPESLTTEEQREQWQRVLSVLPELPTRVVNDKKILWHATEIRDKNVRNIENVNLYAIWPYMQAGVVPGNVQLALDSFHLRSKKFVHDYCWNSDILWAAYSGDATSARHSLARRYFERQGCRFPAFHGGPECGDGPPDLDNGGVCQNTIQSMLMQCDAEKIVLLPAWPKDWDASFKLHAPQNTTVEGTIEDGELMFKVTPESRRKDVKVYYTMPPAERAARQQFKLRLRQALKDAEEGRMTYATDSATRLPVVSIAASSSANSTRSSSGNPRHLIDGSGLEFAKGTHDAGNWQSCWISGNMNPSAQWLALDLGKVCTVSKLRIWNCNDAFRAYFTQRGVSRIDVYTSAEEKPGAVPIDGKDAGGWHLVGLPNRPLLQATGVPAYELPDCISLEGRQTRHVALRIGGSFGGTAPVSLGEIQIFEKAKAEK